MQSILPFCKLCFNEVLLVYNGQLSFLYHPVFVVQFYCTTLSRLFCYTLANQAFYTLVYLLNSITARLFVDSLLYTGYLGFLHSCTFIEEFYCLTLCSLLLYTGYNQAFYTLVYLYNFTAKFFVDISVIYLLIQLSTLLHIRWSILLHDPF